MPSYNDEARVLSTALHVFIDTTGRSTNPERQIAALDALAHMRFAEHIDSVILMGLRSSSQKVVKHTIKICEQRLTAMTDDNSLTQLIELILNDCFLNLSGRQVSTRGDDEDDRILSEEGAAAQLFKTVQQVLLEKRLIHDHHIARVLARSRQIAHLEGTGELAKAIVKFQMVLAMNNADAEEIARLRRNEAYLSPKTSEATLLAYLEMDARLPLEKVSSDLIRIYRLMLGIQTERDVVIGALRNLTRWLDEIPIPGSTAWDGQLENMHRAKPETQWQDFENLYICQHLLFQYEFLAGRNAKGDLHPDDFLGLLQKRYAAPVHAVQLIAGLQFLRRLPALRGRVDDLQAFVLEDGKYQRSKAVWEAFIGLIESQVTGLEAIIPTDQTDLNDQQQRRLRLMKKSLQADQQLRDLLKTLATDFTQKWSVNAEIEAYLRERAWRALIRCLPSDKSTLFRQGLCDFQGRFFLATIDEAKNTAQRGLWTVLESHWDQLLGTSVPEKTRNERLEALAEWFEATRPIAGVLNQGNDFGRVIRIALNSAEPMQERYWQAVIDAGYHLELEKENQRRQVIKNRDDLTRSNSKILQWEAEIANVNKDLTQTQLSKAEQVLDVQGKLAQRDRLITRGWLSTTQLQIDLAELREQLVQVLKMAGVESIEIANLQRRMADEQRASQSLREAINTLVNQQASEEKRRDGLVRDSNAAMREKDTAQSNYNRAKSELAGLSAPTQAGNDQEAMDHWQRAQQAYERKRNQIDSRIRECERQISGLNIAITALSKQISASEQAISLRQSDVNRNRGEIANIERRINQIQIDYNRGVTRWQKLRNEIKQLQSKEADISSVFEGQRAREQSDLKNNTAEVKKIQQNLDEIHAKVASLSNSLNTHGHQRDTQITRSQELVQAIHAGRKNYDDLSERAIPISANIDHLGHGQELATQFALQETQSERAQYAYASQRALKDRPRPPTAEEYQQERHTNRRKGTTT